MKKLTVLLLLCAMLTQLVGCNVEKPVDETQPGTDAATGAVTEAATEEATEEATEAETADPSMHKLSEDLDFGGETFTMAFQNNSNNYYVEESDGTALSNAIYNRQKDTENFLNVELKLYDPLKWEDFTNHYKAGDDSAQLYLMDCIFHVNDAVMGGYLYNLDALPHVDFTADWWDREQMDNLKLGKHTNIGSSDFVLVHTNTIMFNRNMVEANNLEDPYELLFDGKWTMDKFFELSEAVSNDSNGNDVIDIGDTFGFNYGDGSQLIDFMTAAGIDTAKVDEEGIVQLVINTEKTAEWVEKMYKIYERPDIFYANCFKEKVDRVSFADGNILFTASSPGNLVKAAEYEFTVGMLPYPKWNEEQEEYRCLNWSNCLTVPGTIKNPDMVGAVLEYLSWHSSKEFVPAYYDQTLGTKYSEDEQTRKAVQLIFDSFVFDPAENYFAFSEGTSQFFYLGMQVGTYGEKDFASFCQTHEANARDTINKFYTEMTARENGIPMETETTAE
ncbi:MAG: extracellular solute-binding protein [Clostridia bacterium]|nr:extracellular solute-binding protein [Clostridia bacterium]